MPRKISRDQKLKLIQEATEALKNPHAKDYAAVYAAAVLTSRNNIYSAINYFSDTYTLTIHAEPSALAHAANHSESEILAIAIISTEKLKKGDFTNPCHLCKQILYESQRRSGIKMLVILANTYGESKELFLDDMASYLWPV
ncbi:MAG TPA: hypothetical protein VF791_18050 [Pyrinomonadaceae bacterium]